MKVYLVTTGSYSDYSVAAVFADKALAEVHATQLSEANEVEEYEVVETAPVEFVVYNISNNTYRGPIDHEWTYLAWDYRRRLYKRVEVSSYAPGRLRCWGWDQEAVRKAYFDRKAQMQAEAEGIA